MYPVHLAVVWKARVCQKPSAPTQVALPWGRVLMDTGRVALVSDTQYFLQGSISNHLFYDLVTHNQIEGDYIYGGHQSILLADRFVLSLIS